MNNKLKSTLILGGVVLAGVVGFTQYYDKETQCNSHTVMKIISQHEILKDYTFTNVYEIAPTLAESDYKDYAAHLPKDARVCHSQIEIDGESGMFIYGVWAEGRGVWVKGIDLVEY